MDAKAALKIQPMEFPTYSPDLNSLDFALWQEMQNRMAAAAQAAPNTESAETFKQRLCKTAMSIPESVARKMLANIKARAQSVYGMNGGHIPRD